MQTGTLTLESSPGSQLPDRLPTGPTASLCRTPSSLSQDTYSRSLMTLLSLLWMTLFISLGPTTLHSLPSPYITRDPFESFRTCENLSWYCLLIITAPIKSNLISYDLYYYCIVSFAQTQFIAFAFLPPPPPKKNNFQNENRPAISD